MSDKKDTFVVKIIEPERVVFEGEIEGLSSKNKKGEFDILPDHSNFITVVQEKLTLFFPDKSTKEFAVDLGVIRFLEDKVEVYLGINTLSEVNPQQPRK